ncbi:MAG: FAD-dependent oxidoreductase [Gammaproteobacteria bacterium]
MKPIIIIGSGLAGYNVAREFRKYDKDTPITIITRDGGAFYSKPQLSVALAYHKTADDLAAMTSDKMEKTLNATIVTHCELTKILPKENAIVCGEERFEYQSLVLALGADTPVPNIEGNGAKDIWQINDVYEYGKFRRALEGKKRVAVLGSGLVGSEFTNDFVKAGFDVHTVEMAAYPLSLLIPEKVGKKLVKHLEDHGVQWHLNCVATRIDKTVQGYRIHLSDDTMFEADIVLSAIGLRPRVALAAEASIATGRGIIVNRFLQTNIDNIYALGDCAEVEGLVLPYVAPMLESAKALAKTLSGEKTQVRFPAMPVVIKTTLYSICACQKPGELSGEWTFEVNDGAVKGYRRNQENQLLGFVLTQEAVKERMSLQSQCQDWL